MTARIQRRLFATAASCGVIAWLTFPAVIYAYHWFIYPLYYYPFRYRNVVQEFPMVSEVLPASAVNGRLLPRPVRLRFQENLNYSIVVDRTYLASSEIETHARVSVLLSVWGDRHIGTHGFNVERVGSVRYGAAKIAEFRTDCAAPIKCGMNPLDRVICQGLCN